MEPKGIYCVIGAILINLTLGTFYTIGNVVPYVASYMREHGNPDVTSEHGAWLTAAFLLGQGLFIIVGSVIENKFSSRLACIIGCVLHCLSTFLTILAIDVNFVWVILIYGFGSGMGCGSAYMALIIAAQKWFPENKGAFTGIIVAGFGFGGFIFTNLQTLYLNPENQDSNSKGYFGSEVHNKVPSLFLYMGIIFTVAQTIGCALAFSPPKQQGANGAGSVRSPHDQQNVGGTTIQEDLLPTMKSINSAFNQRIFYVLGAMMMLVAPGVTFVNSLGKRYGLIYINDDKYLATINAIAAVANALGRLSWGFLVDKFNFTICISLKVGLFALLISTFPFKFVLASRTMYCIWTLGLFFGFSGTFVLFPVFIEQLFGAKYHGIIYGILYLFLALSSITTSAIIQAFVGEDLADRFYTRALPCFIIAFGYSLCLLLYYFATPTKRLENALRRRKDAAKSRNTLQNRQDLYPIERGTLAEKFSPDQHDGGITKENSLGSIVRYNDKPAQNDARVKYF